MKAFNNDPQIKADLVSQLEAHAAADEIIKGVYWQKGKGCAVGCTLHSAAHREGERRYGIPTVLWHLEDQIFEGLPNMEAKAFPLAFIRAIPVGADLSLVWPRFALWLLTDPKKGVLQIATSGVAGSIQRVSALFRRQIAGETLLRTEWTAAAEVAQAAARATWTEEPEAAWAARVAEAAAQAAETAWAAWAARAVWAAEVAATAVQEQRDQLLFLLADIAV